MTSKVYFVNFQSKMRNVLDKVDELFTASGLGSIVAEGGTVWP